MRLAKARRINRFRAFFAQNSFYGSKDAKADFGLSVQIRTGVSQIRDEHLRAAPFLNGQFPPQKTKFFRKKNHKYSGVVLLVLTGQESGALFQFQKGCQRATLETQAGATLLRPYFYPK